MSIETPSTDVEADADNTPRTGSTTFINTSGGLLTDELVSKLRQRQCAESAVRPETFALPDTEPPEEADLEEDIGETWNTLRERWDELTMDNELFGMDVSDARTKWILKLFQELDFEPVFQRENLEAGGIEANLSHKGWPDGDIQDYGEMDGRTAPILHTVEPGQKLDEKPEGASRGVRSPHDTLQEFLNASDDHDWAVVTNGLTLRVLRDYYHTYTRGYVEFDLENLFTNRNYGDFRALYRLCHASRFIEPVVVDEDDDEAETPLEQLYQVALSTGVKVGQDLQENVVRALETLGNGFLDTDIEAKLKEDGQDAAEDYYQDLLYVVYRLLFLMFAEQRGMMSQRDSLYTEEYSVTKLRERAEQHDGSDRNTDLWEGLKATFQLVGEGDEALGVPGYNGGLFDNDNLGYILDAQCPNEKLLSAVHDLTHIEQEGYQQRISYADLGVEEIGAVYESLLEFTPQLAETVIELEDRTISQDSFYLDDRGMERKETGSYYTDPGLVDELIQSSLKPVVEDRVDSDASTEVQEQQLLDITVCDPAAGSGAFLIAANNFLGQKLAEIRSDSLYPDEQTIRQARRSVVQHCLYGVDLNPMAVELAKVSLWINSAVENKPLSFLDHRVKQGNSLIGTTPDLINEGVPVDAYETSKGRDWHKGNEIRKRVRKENDELDKQQRQVRLDRRWGHGREDYISLAEQLEDIEEGEIKDVQEKERIYRDIRESEEFQQEKLAFDLWTAAFYWPLDGSADEYPTPNTIERIRRDPPKPSDDPIERLSGLQDLRKRTEKIADEESFFHWPLEFPRVYAEDNGFDAILGNPPWETLEMKEKEFFKVSAPEIAAADTQSKRKEMIQELKEGREDLYEAYQLRIDRIESQSDFISDSGRYSLTGQGKINLYAAFSEHAVKNVSESGRAGIVVPTGIATDYNTRDFFSYLVDEVKLVSLFDFVNKEKLFQGIPADQRFCLLTMTQMTQSNREFEFSFQNRSLEMLYDEGRRYSLTKEEIAEINPNTFNCPIFQSKRDKDLSLKIYKDFDVLVNERKETNPWGIEYHTMYNMSSDSNLFDSNTLENLQDRGYKLGDDGIFRGDEKTFLPVWEAKFIHQFDHRFGTFKGVPEDRRFVRRAGTKRVESTEKQNPNYEIIPRYWLDKEKFKEKKQDINWKKDWIFSFRDIVRVTSDARVAMGTICPMHPFVHTSPVLTFEDDFPAERALEFTCLFTSFTFEFALRQSLGGAHITLYILKQLPMPTPDSLQDYQVTLGKDQYRVSELFQEYGQRLTWTSHTLDGLGGDLTSSQGPYIWNQEERERLRAEVDAIVAQIYGLSQNEFEYLLDSYNILKEQEIKEHNRFRTKERCMEAYDRIEVEYE